MSTKNTVAKRATRGWMAFSISSRRLEELRISPPAKAPRAASRPKAWAAKQASESTRKAATATSPGARSRSTRASKAGAAVRLRARATATNTEAAPTSFTTGPAVNPSPAARATTTARMTMPRMSSSTAAPITICPSRVRSTFSSPSTLAVMPMLVAVIAAPAKIAGSIGTVNNTWRPKAPTTKGRITPVRATLMAWPPTAISSSSSLSRPVRNSRDSRPIFAIPCRMGKVLA